MTKANLLAGVSAVSLAMVSPAYAQTQPAAPTQPADGVSTTEIGPQAAGEDAPAGEVVVTARKREEVLQDVPAVVSAITGQVAEDLGGIQNARDVTALTPGVTFIESAQGPTAEPNIRGAGQARLPNSDAAIGLYRDGAYIVGGNLGGRTFQRFDLFDVERIEALRGPQGALYGRNAVGGAINVISRKPDFTKFAGEASLIAGSQKTYASQLIVNVPVSDQFALRGGFDIERQAGGFYYNTFRRDRQDDSYYAAGRLSARFRPTSSLDIILSGDYNEQSYDIGSIIQRPDPDGDAFDVAFNTSQRTHAKQFNLSLGINWDLGFANLVSTSNYRSRQSDLAIDSDGLATLSEVNFFTDDARTFFQELRLQGEEERFNWLVGADFFHLRDEYDQVQSGRALIVTPAMGMTPASTVNPNIVQNTDYRQTGYAAFGSLEYRLTDAFKLEVEGRYSVDEKDLTIDARRADGTPRYADYPVGSPQTMPSDTFHNTSYGATASYTFSRDVLAFARVATAYRSGGFNSELGNPCGTGEVAGTTCNLIDVPARYGEEHSINYEVGLKTSWLDRTFFLNANAYLINYDDILANLNNGIMAMNDPINSAMFLANAGDARASGFEIEMTSRPKLPRGWGRLEMSGSIAHQAGHFTSIAPGITTVADGNKLARLRPFAYNARATWRVPVGRGINFLTALNYAYEEGGFISAENDLVLDTTRRANLRFALDARRYELSFQIRNLFDNAYFVNQTGTGVNGIGTAYRLNDPRSFRAQLKVRW